MKKIVIILIILFSLYITGCDAILEALQEYDDSQATSSPQQSAEANDIPSLPNLDFSQLDLFEDGYQIVEFDHASDGDTAIFIIGDSYVKARLQRKCQQIPVSRNPGLSRQRSSPMIF